MAMLGIAGHRCALACYRSPQYAEAREPGRRAADKG